MVSAACRFLYLAYDLWESRTQPSSSLSLHQVRHLAWGVEGNLGVDTPMWAQKWRCWWWSCSLHGSPRTKYDKKTERLWKHCCTPSRCHQSFWHQSTLRTELTLMSVVQHLVTNWPMVWIWSTKSRNHELLGHEGQLEKTCRKLLDLFFFFASVIPVFRFTDKEGGAQREEVDLPITSGGWVESY